MYHLLGPYAKPHLCICTYSRTFILTCFISWTRQYITWVAKTNNIIYIGAVSFHSYMSLQLIGTSNDRKCKIKCTYLLNANFAPQTILLCKFCNNYCFNYRTNFSYLYPYYLKMRYFMRAGYKNNKSLKNWQPNVLKLTSTMQISYL